MENKSTEENMLKLITKVNNSQNAMGSKISAKINDLMEQISEIKDDIDGIKNTLEEECHKCESNIDNTKDDLKAVDTRIKSVEDRINNIPENLKIQEIYNSNKEELLAIELKLKTLDEEQRKLTKYVKQSDKTIQAACEGPKTAKEETKIDDNYEENIFGATTFFNCNYCTMNFNNYDSLKSHIACNHLRAFKCQHCDRRFRKCYDLEEHLVNVHEEEKMYNCDICELRFVTNWRYKKHIDAHNNNKARTCHYFNNNKDCPYAKRGCKFQHKMADQCQFTNTCTRKMCQFQH